MSTEIRKSHNCVAQNRSQSLGIRCPVYGHLLPSTCSVDAHLVGCGCPCYGHSVTSWWAQSEHLINWKSRHITKISIIAQKASIYCLKRGIFILFLCVLRYVDVILWYIEANLWYFYESSTAIFREVSFYKTIWFLDIYPVFFFK